MEMAAVPVQIDGVLWDQAQKKGTKVTLIGQASILGLTIGGGPIFPPDTSPPEPGPPGHPEHPIWGPPGIELPPGAGFPPVAGHPLPPIPPTGEPPGRPTFPIWGPPGIELPPGSGYPPVAGHPLPPPGTEPPKPILGWEAKPVWTTDTGWVVVLVPKDETLVPTPSA
jgi:hypothetical protein